MKIDLEKIKQEKTIQELLEFGILNIDKPSGPTSFDVSDFVRKTLKELGVRKTSHFGTLDPKVTGVLPISLNRACKLTGFFLGEDKEYVGIMRIHEDIEIDKIKKMISEKFTGKILQTPPVKSRVKRQERQREIINFQLLEKQGQDILFLSEVQGGTYIRKLIDDLGKALNIGAHMLELRRIRAGIFKEDLQDYPSVNLYDFEKAVKECKSGDDKSLRKMIVPAEIVSQVYPVIKIKNNNLKQIFTGKNIKHRDLINKEKLSKELPPGKIICIFCDGKFIEMAEIIDDDEFFAKPLFVLQPV